MLHNDIHILEETPACLEILRAYALEADSSEGQETWKQRLLLNSEAEELQKAQTEAHGLLIAYGFLEIELAGREAGVQYRISREGQQALKKIDRRQEAEQAA